jgi:hypothetical protein
MSISKGETFLAHYGKKGMRWGTRKAPNSKSGSGIVAGPRKYNTKNLSNAELKAVIQRMKLEQEYRDINARSKSEGKKFANEVIRKSGKEFAAKTLTSAATIGLTIAAAKTLKSTPRIKKTVLKILKP